MELRFVRLAVLACALGLGTAGVASASPIATGGQAIPITVSLRLHHEDQLGRLVEEQATPGSRQYHHFLSARQFRDYFAPTAAEYRMIVLLLERAGYRITSTSDSRTVISALAPAGDSAENLEARIPLVRTVVGFDRSPINVASPRLPDQGNKRSLVVAPDLGFGPKAIQVAEDFPVRHGATGSGVTTAMVIDGQPSDSDITRFAKAFGINRTGPAVSIVPVDGGNLANFDGGPAEFETEWITASAPGTSIIVYSVPFMTQKSIVDAYAKIVSDNTADVVDSWWAICEPQGGNLSLALLPLIEQGAAQGISFVSAQYGGNACVANAANFPYGPMLPADSPYGIASGSEAVIETPANSIIASTAMANGAGGVSSLVSPPLAQTRVPGASRTGRSTPDIAVPAEVNGVGASYLYRGLWLGGHVNASTAGTTSALLATYVQMHKSRLGAFDVTLYQLFNAHGYGTYFTDVTTGCNLWLLGKPVCARQGYDLDTGIGGFDGYAIGGAL